MFFSKFGRINWIWTYLFELWFSFFLFAQWFHDPIFWSHITLRWVGTNHQLDEDFSMTYLSLKHFFLAPRRRVSHDGCGIQRAIVEASYEMESWALCWYHDWQVVGGDCQEVETHKNARKIPTKNPGYGWVIKWIGCILMYILYLSYIWYTYIPIHKYEDML